VLEVGCGGNKSDGFGGTRWATRVALRGIDISGERRLAQGRTY
jgi:hypothetical protein